MKVLKTRKEVLKHLGGKSKNIGFIPTMGAIHEGHISLISQAVKQNDYTVCSIFVNRTQFNSSTDFKKYPRTTQEDVEKIANAGCDFLFIPSEKEMFSTKHYENLNWKLAHLENIMEAKFRENHFQGVANIVYNLFKLFDPCKAYFGEKDFQQFCVIKEITSIKKLNIEIVPCPTQRNAQGLALSSRNKRLSKQGKKVATTLYHSLRATRDTAKNTNCLHQVKRLIIEKFFTPRQGLIQLEYFEFATEDKLTPIDVLPHNKKVRAFVAAYIEGVRLIDNLRVNK